MHPTQKGNALFLILIAVALFAALSYAITQSGRGGGTINREQAAIAASQITQYAASVQSAVQRMIINGTPPASLCYEAKKPGSTAGPSCSSPAQYHVFDPEGGGAIWQCPSENQLDMAAVVANGRDWVTNWKFRSMSKASNAGFYIKDLGTNTEVTGRDEFAYLAYVSLAVCQQINKGLGLDQTPVDDTNFHTGASGVTYDITRNVIISNPGQPFACTGIDSESSPYNYYHAMVEQ